MDCSKTAKAKIETVQQQLPLQSSLQLPFLCLEWAFLQQSFLQFDLHLISFLGLFSPHAKAEEVGVAVNTNNNAILSPSENNNFIALQH